MSRHRCGFCDESIADAQMRNHRGSARCLKNAVTYVRRKLSQPGQHSIGLAVGKLIEFPTNAWPGKCYGIASEILKYALVEDETAKLRYGHWLGPVSGDCPIEGFKNGAGFQRHGWIEIPADSYDVLPCKSCDHLEEEHSSGLLQECALCDCPCYEADKGGTIIDPTRWVFEGARPYIYVGRSDHYDLGGNRLRAAMRQPCPDYSASAPRSKVSVWKFSPEAHRFVMDELFDGASGITEKMARWLGNAPLQDLGHHAMPIYRALVDAGEQASIPIDNYRAVLGEDE